MEKILVEAEALCVWVPGIEGRDELALWTQDKRLIPSDVDKASLPDLSFVPAMQRRRLTSLSKLAVALAHRLKGFLSPEAKIYFVSLTGESARQLQVNTMVLQENEVLPATFSTSVFNTPPAMVSILLGLKNGYAALYPEVKDFSSAVQTVLSPLLAGNLSQVLMIYGDVRSPEEYQVLEGACDTSWGFAVLLSSQGDVAGFDSCEGYIPYENEQYLERSALGFDYCSRDKIKTPQDFLYQLLQTKAPLLSLEDE